MMKMIKLFKRLLPVAGLFFLAVGISAAVPYAGAPRYVITAYGAIGDSVQVNTQAIQQTIDACAAKGGGTVVVPKGIFLSGSVFLKKNVALLVEKGGILRGTANPDDYPQVQTRWEGIERAWTAALINARDMDGVNISGEGTVDGSGDIWVKNAAKAKNDPQAATTVRRGRPRLIEVQNCKNVEIKDLKFHNQAVWCVHILYSQQVLLKNLNITADHNIPSSDGIDIDSSNGVKIQNCFIDVNDDCISIKSGKDEDGLKVNRPSENILIEDCHFAYGHGGVAMGSETSGGIRNVIIRNCLVDSGNWAPIRFKSQPSRGGVVENITYENIRLSNTRKAVEFNMAWRMVPPVKPPAKVLPVVRNIRLINITGTVDQVGDISGLEGSPILDVTFKDCSIQAKKGITLQYIQNVDLKGLAIKVEEGEAIIKKNVQ